ncbi:MAG: Gldg family protein [Planctomycetota bacterium]
MKRLDAILLVLLLALSAGVAVEATRVADRHQSGGAWRAELGRRKLTEVEPDMRARLSGLGDKLVFTYYVSARSTMPSQMKRIERDVTDLLGAFKGVAPDRVDFHIVDPETDPEQAGYASNRRITPFRVRDVTHDSWSERLVWSTLTMSYGTYDEAIVNGVTPERLPRLQATLIEHLDRMEAPRRPTFALAAPEGFRELANALAEYGDVVEVDLDGGDELPEEADVLLWMRPSNVTPTRLREIERAIAMGRSIVVAGALNRVPVDGIVNLDNGEPAVRIEPSGDALEPLLAHFGLRPDPGLVLDVRSEVLMRGEQQVPAPFLVRCIAPNQNFVTWRNQPNGTLLFHAPTPLRLQPDVLQELGYQARVHATTSDDTWLQEPPTDAPRPFAELGVERGQPVSKLPLMVSLEPADPWHGRFFALAASTPLEDGSYGREGTAHWRLLRTLTGELASSERLVAAAVAHVDQPPATPELTGGARLLWRLAVVGLVPLLLGLSAFARGAFRRESGGRVTRAGGGVWPRALLALLAAVAVARVAGWPDLRADATDGKVNSLAAETRDIAARAGDAGATRVELLFSSRDRMPPALRERVGRVRATLGDFERAGADFDVVRLDVDDLDDAERERLQADGIEPIRVTTRDEEVTTVRTIYSALRLERDGRREVLAFEDAAAFEFLEFRLAFALWRLETGRRPLIAFAADAERLSAAEDFERYQNQSLFAPKGNDNYSLARALLMRLDFDVVNVTPRQFVQSRKPEIPAGADLVVWMQPRRSIQGMMEETVRYLHGGGRVMVAAQHFQIVSRQYRGREFGMSYWPRPQNPDVDQIYFNDCGVRLVREVLFDELHTEMMVDTEILGRGSAREYERQLSAREFQLRASAANFHRDHPITRNLGDQSFVWGSFIDVDDEQLAANGLSATTLMSTSDRSWTYLWSGGFLEENTDTTPEHLGGPPLDEAGQPQYRGKLPLAVLVEGGFPRPARELSVTMGAEAPEVNPDELENYPDPAPGRLLLVGSSRAFQDDRFHHQDFRADHFLLNAVADMALPPELGAIALRRPAIRGFGFVEPETKLRWRTLVVASPPAALLVLGLVVAFLRRRAPVRAGSAPGRAS